MTTSTTVKPTYDLSITIDPKIMTKMFEYAYYADKHYNSEVAGWGHWNKDKGIYKLAPLTKQEVPELGMEVDTLPDELLANPNYDMSDMVVHWHSHVTSSVFLSGTDKATIKELLEIMPFIMSIVVNTRWEYYCQLDINIGSDAHGLKIGRTQSYRCRLDPVFSNTKTSALVAKKITVIPAPKPKAPTVSQHTTIHHNNPTTRKGTEDYWNEFYTGFQTPAATTDNKKNGNGNGTPALPKELPTKCPIVPPSPFYADKIADMYERLCLMLDYTGHYAVVKCNKDGVEISLFEDVKRYMPMKIVLSKYGIMLVDDKPTGMPAFVDKIAESTGVRIMDDILLKE